MIGRERIVLFLIMVAGLSVMATGCNREASDELVQEVRAVAAQLSEDAIQREDMSIPGLDGWLFFAPELRHVSVGRFWGDRAAEVTRARNADTADPLPAILDFKRQLDALEVELLLVPVPLKSLIYADRWREDLEIPIPVPRLDAAHQTFYTTLRENGIEVLDLTEQFLRDRWHPEGPLYCRQDTHWSGVGCVLAGQQVASVIKARPWYQDLDTTNFAVGWYSTIIDGDLRNDNDTSTTPREELRLRRVATAGEGRPTEVPPDPASPVILLGDSHNLVFQAGGDMHTRGAGLADQLAFELGFAVDLVAVRGSGATAARVNLLRRAQRDPEYWSGKRVVVWCFSAREFTESDGWSLVPLTP